MKRIKIHGWHEGFLKVSFTKILIEYSNIPLNDAKEITDKILNGQEVTISINDENKIKEFIERATKLGAKLKKE